MIDFPDNPAPGDLFAPPTSEITYQWNGIGWRVYGSEAQMAGGFNLVEEIDLSTLAGQVETAWLPLAPGYDYDFELLAPSVAGNSTSFFHIELSPDGGSTVRSSDFMRAQMAGDGVNTINADVTIVTDTPTTAFITSSNGVGAFNGSAFGKLRLHDIAKRTIIQNQAATFGDGTNEGSRYDTHFELNNLEIIDSMRLVLGGGATILDGVLRVFRRSRQPLSFLLGKEPGGMYLHQTFIPAGGETEFDFDLLFGYDYEYKIQGVRPTTTDALLRYDLSEDGGTVWAGETVFMSQRVIGIDAAVATNGGPSGPGFISMNQGSAEPRGASVNGSIESHDDIAIGTATDTSFFSQNQASERISGSGWSTSQFFRVDNKARIAWSSGSTFLAGGSIRIYRRNRAITFP